jgi:signal transduction histidine kinase
MHDADPSSVRHASGPAARWLRALGLGTSAAVVGASAFEHPAPALQGEGLLVTIALLLFIAAVREMSSGPGSFRRETLAALVMIAAASTLVVVQDGGAAIAGLFMAVSYCALRLPLRWSAPVAGIGLAALAVVIAQAKGSAGSVLSADLGLVAFFVLSVFARRVQDAHTETQRLLAELRVHQHVEAEAAALRERTRIAREIHDVLAHSLSGLMLQLEGARMLAANPSANGQLPAALDRAHHLARSGLQEARRAIGALRDEELPGPDRLAELVEDFSRDSGVEATLAVDGTDRPLGSQAALAVFRVAQEALTNTRRHSRAERVEVRLGYEPGAVRLTVQDHAGPRELRKPARETAALAGVSGGAVVGGRAEAPVPDGEPGSTPGYGLTGMRERAELLGGTLAAGPAEGGFRVELWIPA